MTTSEPDEQDVCSCTMGSTCPDHQRMQRQEDAAKRDMEKQRKRSETTSEHGDDEWNWGGSR